MERRGHAFHWLEPQVLAVKQPLEQPLRGGADDHRVGLRQPLQARREVGGVAQGQLFARAACADLADHDQPGVNANPHLEGRDPAGVAVRQGGQDP